MRFTNIADIEGEVINFATHGSLTFRHMVREEGLVARVAEGIRLFELVWP